MDQARRVLQVAVDNDDCIAGTMIEARAECRLVPEIAAEVDNLVVWILGQERFNDFASLVLGTIVYKDELVFDILEFFFKNTVGFGDDFFFVKNRNDYR